MKKKYGVIWSPTKNIGDDIQTLAAINFLNKKGISEYVFVNREKLDKYEGEPINLIMNGWFMRDISKFPPSENINPIFISFHVARPHVVENNVDYFKQHEPIGCRDNATFDLLKSVNIEAYFTGCLTLFFDKVSGDRSGTYFCDCHWNSQQGGEFINEIPYDGEIISHRMPKLESMKPQDRLLIAQEVLSKYTNAKLVITSRLHCALPCRALGTDCIFVHKKLHSDPRFKGLGGTLNGDVKYHENKNPDEHSLSAIRKFFEEYKL